MIIGIGCDIVELKRIDDIKDLEKFAARVLTDHEIFIYNNLNERKQTAYLAGRFAAKEAFAKATGYGIGARLSLLDMSILNHENGAPYMVCSLLPENHVCHISIAHERSFAIAYCIISQS